MFRTGKDKDGFSLGKYNNFQEVFGDNARLWFLPIFSRYVHLVPLISLYATFKIEYYV